MVERGAAMPHWTDADPSHVFDGRAALYERGRPAYPSAALDVLLAGLGDPAGVRVADVGAGTGLLSRLLLARGCGVVAVEPNAEMREAAPELPGLRWVAATAEDTGLPDAAFDLVTVAQAFHWVDPRRALPEFRRLVVPRGRLALLWNDRRVESPFEREYQQLLRELKPPERRDSPPKDSALALSGTDWFEDPAVSEFEHEHLMTVDALVARTLSLSYAPTESRARTALEARLRALHAAGSNERGLLAQGYRVRVHVTHALD